MICLDNIVLSELNLVKLYNIKESKDVEIKLIYIPKFFFFFQIERKKSLEISVSFQNSYKLTI